MFFARSFNLLRKTLFWKDKIILINLALSLVIFFVLGFLFISKIKVFQASNQLLLHYNIYFGIDWIGEWYKIFIYPLISVCVFIINFSFGLFFYDHNKFLSYLMILSLTFCEIIIFIAGLSALWINS